MVSIYKAFGGYPGKTKYERQRAQERAAQRQREERALEEESLERRIADYYERYDPDYRGCD